MTGRADVAAPTSGFRTFVILWAGQSVSLVGSSLTGFALAVYVYQLTGSATILGSVFALNLVPMIIASPVGGVLVDRWGTRRALFAANVGKMLVTLALAVLLVADAFAVWHVYLIVSALSVLSALEIPAFASVAPQLVATAHLGRANGMRMFAMAVTEVVTPIGAGFLLLAIGIEGLVLLDLLSFGLALATLAVARLPRSGRPVDPASSGRRGWFAEFADGWRHIAARRGLVALLVFLGAVNFSAGFIELLITPLVLAFAPSGALGTVLSIGGLGMIITSVLVSVWGGPRRRVRALLLFSLVLAVATVAGSARPNVALVAAAAFVFMGALGIVITTNQVIWQTKVEQHLMGRVMATMNMVGSAPQLVAYLLAGVAVDRIFEPLVGRDEVRSPAIATLVGHGPGRGIALLMMVTGALIAITVGIASLSSRLRRLEDELPDAAPAGPVAEPGEPAVVRS